MAQVQGRLAGRKILISGAAAGIGLSTARACLAQGAAVFLMDQRAEPLADVMAQLGCGGHCADVTDDDAVADCVAMAAARMGGLDGLVNSAGVMLRGSLAEVDSATWRRVLEINLTGPYLMAQAALPHLRKAPDAAIVNIASAQALLPNSANRSAYCASKGGLLNLTRALAAELAPAIRVNSVCPGLVDTGMADGVRQNVTNYAMGRLAQPSEIAAAITFLLSREAAFITGAALAVDGGRSFH